MDVHYKALEITVDTFEFVKPLSYFVTVQTDCSSKKASRTLTIFHSIAPTFRRQPQVPSFPRTPSCFQSSLVNQRNCTNAST